MVVVGVVVVVVGVVVVVVGGGGVVIGGGTHCGWNKLMNRYKT
jgi:hypothetical protein